MKPSLAVPFNQHQDEFDMYRADLLVYGYAYLMTRLHTADTDEWRAGQQRRVDPR